MISKTHHFFLLLPSPWPILSSLSAFNLLFSLMLFLKFSEFFNFFWNIIGISFISFSWWLLYGGEFKLEGKVSFLLEKGLKIFMMLFISSEVFFFFSFFWSYFQFFLSPTLETGLIWPPFSLEMFCWFNVPLINTLILLSSGITVTISHFYILCGGLKSFSLYLMSTVILGGFFSGLQLLEYLSSFFCISDSTFGTSFFMLTGFHGLHVIIGTLYLFTCLVRTLESTGSKESFLSFEMASWYWHFVDVVWIFLFFFLYYLNF